MAASFAAASGGGFATLELYHFGACAGVDLSGRHVSALQMIHPAVIAAHEGFTEFLLNHENPYMGKTWGAEPDIAMVEVYNEGDPFYLRRAIHGLAPQLLDPLHKQWRAWLW